VINPCEQTVFSCESKSKKERGGRERGEREREREFER
jgi:hypothetical protein